MSSAGFLAYAEKWNGAKWAVLTTPNSVGAGNSLGASRIGTLAERWNGTKWTIQATPVP